MNTYVAFLRGVNVGRDNVLRMSDLKKLCENLGFKEVHTYIQSGNVFFESALKEEAVIKKLEGALEKHMGRRIAVSVRTKGELKKVLAKNPFRKANPAQVGVTFFPGNVPSSFVKDTILGNEEMKAEKREVYVHYPDGMGRAKIKFPNSASTGTVRNVNTISKIVALLFS